MKTNGDDLAFGGDQSIKLDDGSFLLKHQCLTKREYFAAMAMQGLCANSVSGRHRSFENLTEEAVYYADNLIERLNGEK